MQAPSKIDYVRTYFILYEGFEQGQKDNSHRSHPYNYETKVLILFFIIMMIHRITTFKAQHRWLKHHELVQVETVSLDESKVVDQKKMHSLHSIQKRLSAITLTSKPCGFDNGQSKGS